jgi:plasmid stabilization system protein ParE
MADSATYHSIFSLKAKKEIEEAWLWYEERLQGLGDKFTVEVIRRLKQIELQPERYPIIFKNYRETRIETFPYLIIYRENKKKKTVFVLSVFHGKRNPTTKFRK